MSLLITRPKHDPLTHYLYYWSVYIIEEAKRHKHNIYDIKKKNVIKSKVESYLKKQNPGIVIFNGHGSSTTVCGDDNQEIVTAGNNNDLFKNKDIFVRSCDCGQILGRELIRAGARGFIGYSQPYYLPYNSDYVRDPLKDVLAGVFIECSNQVGVSLVKGHPIQEAQELSMKTYRRKLFDMLNSENSSDLAWMLFSNMKSQVCFF